MSVKSAAGMDRRDATAFKKTELWMSNYAPYKAKIQLHIHVQILVNKCQYNQPLEWIGDATASKKWDNKWNKTPTIQKQR